MIIFGVNIPFYLMQVNIIQHEASVPGRLGVMAKLHHVFRALGLGLLWV